MKRLRQMTMSFSKGKKSETSIKHNNRSIEKNFDFDKKGHQHIERQYTSMNEVLVHDDIRDVYKQEFGEAVEKYNAKQKRKDRKIDDYYSKIKHSKKERTQIEFLVQVGNQKDFNVENRKTSQLWQDGKKILEKYYEDFRKRNPNLRVYNAAIHMDEQGAPHMHMNVVPIAHMPNAKRGLTVKPSLNRALAEEGFPKSKEDNRKQFRDFQHREADALANIAKDYGIERQQGIVNKLKDVHEYKQAMRKIDDMEQQQEKLFDIEVEKRVQERTKKLIEENEHLRAENEHLHKFVNTVMSTFEAYKDRLGVRYKSMLQTLGAKMHRIGLRKLPEGWLGKKWNVDAGTHIRDGYVKDRNYVMQRNMHRE